MYAAIASFLDDANVFGSFTLDGDGGELDVRVVHGNVRLLGYFDFFHQGVERFVGFIADVRAVETTVFGGAAGHGHEFGGVAVTADFVFEAAGESDGAFVHGLPGKLGQFFDFLWRRNAIENFDHDLFAYGGVSGEDGDVERGGIFAAVLDPIFYWPGRIAIGTLYGGGDALRDLRFGEGIGVETFDGVIVDVNEAGS